MWDNQETSKEERGFYHEIGESDDDGSEDEEGAQDDQNESE